MMHKYPIMANCNFESRDDDQGKAVHAARVAVEAGFTSHGVLVDALDALETTLAEYADQGDPVSVDICEAAEMAVVNAWTEEVQSDIADARQAEYRN